MIFGLANGFTYSWDNLVVIKKENKKIKTVEGEKQVYNLHTTFFSHPLNHSFPFKGLGQNAASGWLQK